MKKLKEQIKDLTEEQKIIRDTYKDEIEAKKKIWETLVNSTCDKINKVETKKTKLYHSLLKEIIKDNKIDFSRITKLIVDEANEDDYGDEYTEYYTYKNVNTENFRIQEFTEYRESNTPLNYKFEDLTSLLHKLNNNDKSKLEITYDEEWNNIRINDIETMEDYTLDWDNNKENVEIEIDTQNEEGTCTLTLIFSLK